MSAEALLAAAREAREHAYAPYSHYSVGAAVLGEDGRIWTGCNIENASYSLALCAERVAIFKMVSSGSREFREIAVSTKDGGNPCGSCLQVMSEFGRTVMVYLENEEREVKAYRLDDLLPHPFRL